MGTAAIRLARGRARHATTRAVPAPALP
jgi:hypothetical protein